MRRGTALVLLAVTLEFLVDGRPLSIAGTALRLAESYAGGIAIGAAVAHLLIPLRRRPHRPRHHRDRRVDHRADEAATPRRPSPTPRATARPARGDGAG
ncbi:hypothetical protein GCM10022221_63010 [Actinocorallia aurea]